MSMNQEQLRLTKLLAPLIVFIVLIIVLTLIFHGRVLSRKEDPGSAPVVEMRLDRTLASQLPLRQDLPKDVSKNIFPNVDQEISSAHYELSSGYLVQAEERLRTALVFYPDHKKILHLLGSVLYKQKKYVPAEKVFRHLLKQDVSDATARNNLAAVLAARNLFPEAVTEAEKAYKQDNSSAVTALNLASIYSRKGDKEKALEYFRKAYEKLGVQILSFISNHNFDPIRQEKVFRDIVHEAQKKRSQTTK